MDDTSHAFLIKDKIRCIQKKIMDQLAADLNSALNDANLLPSSLSNVPMGSSSSSATITKIKRRRKRPINNDTQQPKIDLSDSTTPENSQNRHFSNKQSIVSDSDDMPIASKTQSSSLAAASESDSASQTDEIQRRRRPFKKPIIPPTVISALQTERPIKLVRCPSIRVTSATTISTPLRRRRRNCRSDSHCRINDLVENPSSLTSSSSAFALSMNNAHYAGKRKRSRTIVHDDFRLRNNSLHDYDMTCIDDANLTNISSSSSLNLSDSDKDPCLTSNEADDEQSDWPRDESSVPRVISWWEDNDDDDDKSDDADNDEKMLTTTDGALQKIVNGAISMMLDGSKTALQDRIKTYVHREMLTGNRRNLGSKGAYTHPHQKRHVRLLKDPRRSHHNSYNHKRVKSDHSSHKHNEIVAPIDATNIGHQLLEKIGWTPGNGLGINQNGITAPVQINYRHFREGLGYETASTDTIERMESEQVLSSLTSHPSHL